MRCTEPIKVQFSIPVPIDKPDGNGIIYTKEAIKNAVKNFKGNIPLIVFINKEIGAKVIGNINTFDFLENINTIIADGNIFFGGTNDKCEWEDKIVNDTKINAIGIDAEGAEITNVK